MNLPFCSYRKDTRRVFALLGAWMLVSASGATPPAATPLERAALITPAADPVVLTVDGEAVSAAEYTLVMNGRVAEVFAYFHGKDGREDRLGYWADDGQSENPIRKLREFVITELRTLKTLQVYTREKGLLRDASYAAFREAFEQENSRRAQARAKQEVIYGPTRYQEHRYYYFRQSDLRQAALGAYQKDAANTVPVAEIEAFLAENRAHFQNIAEDEARERIIRILQKKNFEQLLQERAARARVEINAEVLASITPRRDS